MHPTMDLLVGIICLTATLSYTQNIGDTTLSLSNNLEHKIIITHIPAKGSYENLKGRINIFPFTDYRIAVYINYGGWYNKPLWADPLTNVSNNGDFSVLAASVFTNVSYKEIISGVSVTSICSIL